MESQPQNPEFGNNPENFHPCTCIYLLLHLVKKVSKKPFGKEETLKNVAFKKSEPKELFHKFSLHAKICLV